MLASPFSMPVGFPPRLPALPLEFDPVTDGGGGTILTPLLPDGPRRDIPELVPVAAPEADGGGGTTFAAIVPPGPPEVLREVELTLGGGGTTSCVPKSFPMMLLTNDPLPT